MCKIYTTLFMKETNPLGNHMTPDEYKCARKQLGMNVSEWIEKLGISIDTHKNFSSGRNGRDTISATVANHIQTLLELQALQKQVGED